MGWGAYFDAAADAVDTPTTTVPVVDILPGCASMDAVLAAGVAAAGTLAAGTGTEAVAAAGVDAEADSEVE